MSAVKKFFILCLLLSSILWPACHKKEEASELPSKEKVKSSKEKNEGLKEIPFQGFVLDSKEGQARFSFHQELKLPRLALGDFLEKSHLILLKEMRGELFLSGLQEGAVQKEGSVLKLRLGAALAKDYEENILKAVESGDFEPYLLIRGVRERKFGDRKAKLGLWTEEDFLCIDSLTSPRDFLYQFSQIGLDQGPLAFGKAGSEREPYDFELFEKRRDEINFTKLKVSKDFDFLSSYRLLDEGVLDLTIPMNLEEISILQGKIPNIPYALKSYSFSDTVTLVFNLKSPIFKQKDLRLAFSSQIRRKEINEKIYNSAFRLAEGIVPPECFFEGQDYRAQVGDLLSESLGQNKAYGFEIQGDFKPKLLIPKTLERAEELTAFLQKNFQGSAFSPNIEILEEKDFWLRVQNKDYDLVIMKRPAPQLLAIQNLLPFFKSFKSGEFSFYKESREPLLEAFFETPSLEKLQAIESDILQDLYVVPLFNAPKAYFLRPQVLDFDLKEKDKSALLEGFFTD